jgi:hypothetical protein
MKQIFTSLFLLFSISLQAQNRVVINNDGFIVISSGAFLVVDNANTNAIVTTGTGGNILSEAENNRVKWNIGTNTGAYTVPFTSKAHVKIPLTTSLITTGTGTGHILFSTYTDNDAADSWNNLDYMPSVVNNMRGGKGLINNSPYVVDRFWIIDEESYTAQPTANITFGYDLTNEVTVAGNSLSGGDLVAQYYEESVNQWVNPASGADNLAQTRVEGANHNGVGDHNASNIFYKVWTLTGKFNILPVELLDFVGTAKEGYNLLEWRTVSELTNDYFELQRSVDAVDWQVISKVNGQGTSTQTTSYKGLDKELNHDMYYYRLKQVDFDGKFTYTKTISLENLSNSSKVGLTLVYPNPATEYINLSYYSPSIDEVQLSIMDVQGRKVKVFTFNLEKGQSMTRLNLQGLAKGYYFIKIVSQTGFYQIQKPFIKN